MVRWYHAIFSAYGFWLPNDPRGSWSEFVAAYELYRFGPATKTNEKRSLAHDPHDRERRREAKQHLRFPPVRLNSQQRECVARGIERACSESDIKLFALAIGYDHVHVVAERHEKTIERVVGQFKGRATQAMTSSNVHPLRRFADEDGKVPQAFCEGCWSVFVNDKAQLSAAIAYVERHPVKEGLPAQRWTFIESHR